MSILGMSLAGHEATHSAASSQNLCNAHSTTPGATTSDGATSTASFDTTDVTLSPHSDYQPCDAEIVDLLLPVKSPSELGIRPETLREFQAARVQQGWRYPTYSLVKADGGNQWKPEPNLYQLRRNSHHPHLYQWEETEAQAQTRKLKDELSDTIHSPLAYNLDKVAAFHSQHENRIFMVGSPEEVWVMHQCGLLAISPFEATLQEQPSAYEYFLVVFDLLESLGVRKVTLALRNDAEGTYDALNAFNAGYDNGVAVQVLDWSKLAATSQAVTKDWGEIRDVPELFAATAFNTDLFRQLMQRYNVVDFNTLCHAEVESYKSVFSSAQREHAIQRGLSKTDVEVLTTLSRLTTPCWSEWNGSVPKDRAVSLRQWKQQFLLDELRNPKRTLSMHDLDMMFGQAQQRLVEGGAVICLCECEPPLQSLYRLNSEWLKTLETQKF